MSLLSKEVLDYLLPRAAVWAIEQERAILEKGKCLDEDTCLTAASAGVKEPTRVRIQVVRHIPLPEDQDLRSAAMAIGLGGRSVGQALGYGIFILDEYYQDKKTIAHELVHVAQYERCGGILNFFKTYFMQCNEVGYQNAPMEREAEDFADTLMRCKLV